MTKEIATGYSERADQFKKEQAQYTKQLTYTSMLRLVLFLVFAWFLYTTFTKRFQGYDMIYALLALIVFLAVVFWAGGLQKKIKFLQQLISINENELAIGNGVPSFLDNGSLFTPVRGFTVDLNIFGNHSLYHLLNRAGSLSGKAQLAKRLQNPFLESADINGYQACVKELAGKIQFRQTLLAHTLLLQEEEALSGLQSKIPEDDFAVLTNRFWSILSFVWPAAGALLIIYCAVKDCWLLACWG
jgi:Ca2+/Na+ antiporter